MSVVAVVLARDRTEVLARTLAALDGQTARPERVVVVDNAGTDAVREVIAGALEGRPGWEPLHLERNAGCAGGFAAGLDRALQLDGAEYVVGFDDDATPAPDCVERLVEAARATPSAGAVGAVAHDEDGRLSWAMYVDGARTPARTVGDLERRAAGRDVVEIANTGWQGLLLPVDVLRRHGGPWADLFLQFEDVELGLRLRAAGLTFALAVRARTLHPAPPPTRLVTVLGRELEVTTTTPEKTFLSLRNGLVVWWRHLGPRALLGAVPMTLLRAVLEVAAAPERGASLARYVLVGGVADAVRGRLGPAAPYQPAARRRARSRR